jgi:hypothetical protein
MGDSSFRPRNTVLPISQEGQSLDHSDELDVDCGVWSVAQLQERPKAGIARREGYRSPSSKASSKYFDDA